MELVFTGYNLKKSIGLRKPPAVILRELDDDFEEDKDIITDKVGS